MANLDALALDFCREVASNQSLGGSSARLGAWMIGVAEKTGGFPIEVSYKDIERGFQRGDITVSGLGGRHETLYRAIDILKGAGWLKEAEGRYVGFGHNSKLFTLGRHH